jgi:hypothetical protein
MENGSNATIKGHEFFVQEHARKDVINVRQYSVYVEQSRIGQKSLINFGKV